MPSQRATAVTRAIVRSQLETRRWERGRGDPSGAPHALAEASAGV